jgi:osmoprotectant transport system permease protein
VKYQALAAGDVDVIDGYSTDGAGGALRPRGARRRPPLLPALRGRAARVGRVRARRARRALALTRARGRLDEATVRELNRRVEVDGEPAAGWSADALRALGLAAPGPAGTPNANAPAARPESPRRRAAYLWAERRSIAARAGRHLAAHRAGARAACLVGVPLGLWLERRPAAGPAVRARGVLQTIPGIALLAFMIPLLGVGVVPAFVALFLYGLYPSCGHVHRRARRRARRRWPPPTRWA